MIDTKSFEKLGMTPKDGKLTSEQIATVKELSVRLQICLALPRLQ